jgi:hypothetical protein
MAHKGSLVSDRQRVDKTPFPEFKPYFCQKKRKKKERIH